MKPIWMAIGVLIWSGQVVYAEAEVRPFEVGSMQSILQHHAGRPTLLAFWSVECPPCMGELKSLAELGSNRPYDLVLVSVDHELADSEVAGIVAEIGLVGADLWQFADPFVARLRYSVDPRWQGELPRSEWFGRDGQRESRIGALTPAHIQAWLQRGS